jgi:hypothetical protein
MTVRALAAASRKGERPFPSREATANAPTQISDPQSRPTETYY